MRSSQICATIMMSGGIDSAACAHFLRQQGFGVDALFLDYGQAAAKLEAKAVMALSRHLGISIQRFNLSGSGPFGTGELVGRNALLVFAALFLTRGRSGLLALGLHGGTPYYDCSGPFLASIAHLVSEHTNGCVSVIAPFIAWTKKEVCAAVTDQRLYPIPAKNLGIGSAPFRCSAPRAACFCVRAKPGSPSCRARRWRHPGGPPCAGKRPTITAPRTNSTAWPVMQAPLAIFERPSYLTGSRRTGWLGRRDSNLCILESEFARICQDSQPGGRDSNSRISN